MTTGITGTSMSTTRLKKTCESRAQLSLYRGTAWYTIPLLLLLLLLTRLAARVFPSMPGQSLVVVADSFCCYDCRCSIESYTGCTSTTRRVEWMSPLWRVLATLIFACDFSACRRDQNFHTRIRAESYEFADALFYRLGLSHCHAVGVNAI